jgi:hypothetical protein
MRQMMVRPIFLLLALNAVTFMAPLTLLRQTRRFHLRRRRFRSPPLRNRSRHKLPR